MNRSASGASRHGEVAQAVSDRGTAAEDTKQPQDRASISDWVAFAAAIIGALMAVLDMSIVNASLPVIQGEIGATRGEATWVNTSYVVAEIVILPLTAWLERMIGLRRLMLIAGPLFAIFSILCGFAGDLSYLIFGRIGQGLSGGTLIPSALTVMAQRLPRSQQSVGFAIFGLAAFAAPIAGPVLGGWLTETISWRYAFFINVPVCVIFVAMLIPSMHKADSDWSELANADWFGIIGMTIGLGSMTVILEEGHSEGWLASTLIQQLSVAAILGFIMVALGQIRSKKPVLELRLLRDPNLAANMLLVAVIGGLLFSTLFMVPQFLAAISNYNALQSGKALIYIGVTAMIASMFYPIAVSRFDIKILIGLGMLSVALATYLASRQTGQSTGHDFTLSLLIIGFGSSIGTVPLQQAAIAAVPLSYAAEAACLFNVSRNIGAAVALAALASFQEQRLELHHWRINATFSETDLDVQTYLDSLVASSGSAGDTGLTIAQRMLDLQVAREALVITFNDVFLVLAVISLIATPLVLLLRPIDLDAAGSAMTH